MALSPNEGLKQLHGLEKTEAFRVGMALSPNEGLKPTVFSFLTYRYGSRNGAKPE